MKILKLPAYYEPEQMASSHLTTDLNEAFIHEGYIIENYVPMPSRGISREIRNEYRNRKYEVSNNGHIIVNRFSMFPERKSTIQRAIRYILVNVIQYFKGIHAKDIDLIFAGSTPPTQGLLCAKVKKKLSKKRGKNIPFVYMLQDIFPDSLVNAKMTKNGSFVWKIGRRLEDYTYRNADKIITISDDFKANILAKGVPSDKIVVIPNWINTDNVFPVSREENALFDRLKLDRSLFYVCYSGNIGHSQNMELLINTAITIKDEFPEIRFVLIGEGAAKEKIENLVSLNKLNNVLIFPFQDYSVIEQVYSLGDVGLIISKPGVGGSSVPSKTWSIMAAKRPILASFDKNSSLAKLIYKVGCGIVADAGNKEEFVSGLKHLYYDCKMRSSMGEKGKEYIETFLKKKNCIQAYIDVINSLL